MSAFTKSLTVAITGMNARPDNPGPGLAVARCLREHPEFRGRIIGLGYDVLDPGLYTETLTDSTYLLPYPSAGEMSLLARIAAIHAKEKIDILIPCLDAELASIARLQPQLTQLGIRTLTPTGEQLAMRAKDRLNALCKEANVPSPETKPVTSASFFYSCADQGWSYPLVVKGVFYDAGVARTPDEAASIFHRIAAEWGVPVLVQRHVEGDEMNLAALGDGQGGMVGAVMMRKRALTNKGKAWAGITVHDPDLEDAARRLIAALKWLGPLEVEMLRDRNGAYHLIEINPRFPAWIYLSHGVGVNLPFALVQTLQGRTPKLPACQAGTMFIRYAHEEIVSLDEFQQMTMFGARAPSFEQEPHIASAIA